MFNDINDKDLAIGITILFGALLGSGFATYMICVFTEYLARILGLL